MAYPASGIGRDYNKGICPPTHPKAIYSLFYEFEFQTSIIKDSDFNRWVYAMGDATRYGLHGDFINGWTNQTALEKAMATCTGYKDVNDPNCSLKVNGVLGRYNTLKPTNAEPNENVGLNGLLTQLPGTNPITGVNGKLLNATEPVFTGSEV